MQHWVTITTVNARGMHVCGNLVHVAGCHVVIVRCLLPHTQQVTVCGSHGNAHTGSPTTLCTRSLHTSHLNGRSASHLLSHLRESSQLVARAGTHSQCCSTMGVGRAHHPVAAMAMRTPLLHAPITADLAAIAEDRVTWLHQRQMPSTCALHALMK